MGPLVPGPQTHLLLLSHVGPFLSCHQHSLVSGSCIFPWISMCLCILTRSVEDCLLESDRGLGARPGFSPAVWSPEAAQTGVGGLSSPDPAGKGGLCTQTQLGRAACAPRLWQTVWPLWAPRPIPSFLSTLCGCISPVCPAQASP